MSSAVEIRRAAELTILGQIEKLVGWLANGEPARQKLLQAVAALRSVFSEEAKTETRLHAALTQLQQHVVRIRSGPIRKLLKIQVAAMCRSRDVAVAWKVKRAPRRKTKT